MMKRVKMTKRMRRRERKRRKRPKKKSRTRTSRWPSRPLSWAEVVEGVPRRAISIIRRLSVQADSNRRRPTRRCPRRARRQRNAPRLRRKKLKKSRI